MLTRTLTVVAVLLLASLAVFAQDSIEKAVQPETTEATSPAKHDPTKRSLDSYRIRVGDVLSVFVWQHEELTQERLAVPSDGTIAFPPVGKVELLDKTVFDIARDIESRLVEEDFLTSPTVGVIVSEYSPRYVFLTGAVQGRVALPAHKNIRLLELLAMSGHLGSPSADWANVTVYRFDDEGALYSIPVSVTDILKKGATEKNVVVFEGDYVEVNQLEDTENPLARDHVYVLGSVRKPGRHPIVSGRVSFTLTSLIALAGDFTEFADRSEIVIIRRTDSGRQRIVVDFEEVIDAEKPDVDLLPDDLIYVDEEFL